MHRSIATSIGPHLPHVRRFARALTGSRARGDGYVLAMLETLITETSIYDEALPPRCATYKAFLRVWSAMPLNHGREPILDGVPGPTDRRIESLSHKARQAFLLATVEELSIAEIAAIMGTDEVQVTRLIDEAGREIAEQITARALIIEDEPLIALDLEHIVSDIGHHVVGVARTKDEATSMAERVKPGIVLADVQLADGSSGVDAVNEILGGSDIPIIFITAYPERLLTGHGAEPTFIITKPFRAEMVKAVVSQALFFDMKSTRSPPKAGDHDLAAR